MIREGEITTIRQYFLPIRLANIKYLITHSVGKNVRKWVFSYSAAGSVTFYILLRGDYGWICQN